MEKLNDDMSTPAYLRSAARGALLALRAPIRMSRIGLAIIMAMSAVACSDVTGPGRQLDRDAVENILPAVTDARRRVASGISDVSVRQQMTMTLSDVEVALRADDVATVVSGVTSVSTLMNSYGTRAPADRAEVSAVYLVLMAVQKISSPGTPILASP
jgi:hypothetical protein